MPIVASFAPGKIVLILILESFLNLMCFQPIPQNPCVQNLNLNFAFLENWKSTICPTNICWIILRTAKAIGNRKLIWGLFKVLLILLANHSGTNEILKYRNIEILAWVQSKILEEEEEILYFKLFVYMYMHLNEFPKETSIS